MFWGIRESGFAQRGKRKAIFVPFVHKRRGKGSICCKTGKKKPIPLFPRTSSFGDIFGCASLPIPNPTKSKRVGVRTAQKAQTALKRLCLKRICAVKRVRTSWVNQLCTALK